MSWDDLGRKILGDLKKTNPTYAAMEKARMNEDKYKKMWEELKGIVEHPGAHDPYNLYVRERMMDLENQHSPTLEDLCRELVDTAIDNGPAPQEAVYIVNHKKLDAIRDCLAKKEGEK